MSRTASVVFEAGSANTIAGFLREWILGIIVGKVISRDLAMITQGGRSDEC